MAKKRINLYIDEQTWLEFRMWCLKTGVSASEVLEGRMLEILGKPNDGPLIWDEKDEPEGSSSQR